jgi:hypothetical protein
MLVAQKDNTPPAPTTPTAYEPPPTTTPFGSETEINIALDDDGNIVPAQP